MKRNITITSIILVSCLLTSSYIPQTKADDVHVSFAYLYYWDLSTITQDGVVDENEYPDTIIMEDLAGDFVSEVSWGQDNDTIAIAIRINGTGWMGLGMGEVGIGMAGADIIMASYDPETDNVTIQDMKSIKNDDPIIDENQYPFLSVGGREVNGQTTIEFTIPLASSDTAGNDHFWHIGSEFGFFTAYRKTGKEFNREHLAHSQSETVMILDQTFLPPKQINNDFSITFDESTSELVLLTILSEKINNHEVGFFQDTLFGELKIKDVFTDDQGRAEIRFKPQITGEIKFTSIFYGDAGHKRNEKSIVFNLGQKGREEPTEYNDLRDVVGNRFMRNFLLFAFFIIITMLIYVYSTLIKGLYHINKIGKNFDNTTKEIGEKQL